MSAEVNPLTVVTPRSRRRKRVGILMEALATAAAILAIVVLAIVVISVARKGLPAINADFFTKNPAPVFQTGGGIKNAIVGTLIMTGMATVISVPVGVLIAIFNTEFAPPRVAEGMRIALNVLAGVPTIVIGIFIFGLLVVGHGQSGFAAAVALAIIEVPLIARSSQEVLLLVPGHLREAADALGVQRWRSVLGVILPSAMGGIVTGTLLAIARAAGETAPVILLCSLIRPGVHVNAFSFGTGLDTITGGIFIASEQADPYSQARAWGAAFVLLAFILFTSLGARALLNRNRRRLSG